MDIKVNIIPYKEEECICLDYVTNAKIECIKNEDDILVRANSEGLQFLAKLCLTLAQNDTPIGSHVHLDNFNFFSSNNINIIVEKD